MLENDLNTFYRIWGETCATEAESRIKQFAQEEMEAYYGEYDPIVYIPRTNQMKNSSYTPFREKTDCYYTGGVLINFESPTTNHEPRGISEEAIYDLVWERGKHYIGGSTYTGKRKYVGSGINHYKAIQERAYAIKEEINEIGLRKAREGKYSILSFK